MVPLPRMTSRPHLNKELTTRVCCPAVCYPAVFPIIFHEEDGTDCSEYPERAEPPRCGNEIRVRIRINFLKLAPTVVDTPLSHHPPPSNLPSEQASCRPCALSPSRSRRSSRGRSSPPPRPPTSRGSRPHPHPPGATSTGPRPEHSRTPHQKQRRQHPSSPCPS